MEWAGEHRGFPSGPHVWRELDGGKKLECIGVGSVAGKQREERICVVHKDNVWGGQAFCQTKSPVVGSQDAAGAEAAALSGEIDKLALSEPDEKEKAIEVNGAADKAASAALPTTVA